MQPLHRHGPPEVLGYVLLTAWRAPPLVVVAFSAAAGIAAAML